MTELLVLADIINEMKHDVEELAHISYESDSSIYRDLLAAVFEGAYRCDLVHIRNPILARIARKTRRLIHTANNILDRSLTSLGFCDVLRRALNYVREINGRARRIIVCDALGLHDVLFFLYKFMRAETYILYELNPGGMTRTFEFMIRSCPEVRALIPHGVEEITLQMVADILAKILKGTSDVYREIDDAIMSSPSFSDFDTLVYYLYFPLSRLINRAEEFIKIGYSVFIIADHGYDLNTEEMKLEHCWREDKPSLSVLAPIMILREGVPRD